MFIFFIVFIVAVTCLLLVYLLERRIWNKGICRKNGILWVMFDISSQGCRGYKAGDQFCWITYPFIDAKAKGNKWAKENE